jgi:hypothetical protein
MKLFAYTSLCFLLTNCSNQDQVAHSYDVSTSNNAYLIWSTDGSVFQGECQKDVAPRRAVCSNKVQSKKATEAAELTEKMFVSDLSAVETSILNEVARLKNADPTVISLKVQIQAVTSEQTVLSQKLKTVGSEIETLAAAQATLTEELKAYDAQIIAIHAKLSAEPSNLELQKLFVQIQSERALNAERLETVNTSLAQSIAQRTEFNADLETVKTRAEGLNHELKTHFDALVVTSPSLAELSLRKDLLANAKSQVATVVKMVETQDVVYRGSVLNSDKQLVLSYLSKVLSVPSVLVKAGRYQVESGYKDFCKHIMTPTVKDGNLSSVNIILQSPCSNTSFNLTCKDNSCAGTLSGYRFNWKLIDATHYHFSREASSSYQATFVWIAE